jgi:hypothetical protein
LWEPFIRSLLSRSLFSGTFRYREPFSQELYLKERLGGNFLAGTFWQERFETPPFVHKAQSRNVVLIAGKACNILLAYGRKKACNPAGLRPVIKTV